MKKKRQKGSITVEAALFLPLFFLAFLSIYNLVYFARAQLIFQYAADQAAKEVAQYSYILEKTGILVSLDELAEEDGSFQEDIASIKEQLGVVQDAAGAALQEENVIQNAIEAGSAFGNIYDTVQTYVDDPASFIDGVLAAFKLDAVNGISNYMINTVAKSCVLKQLSIAGGNIDPTEYQQSLGVTSFFLGETSWCENKTRDVRIVIDFQVKNRIPFFEMEPRHYRVCASTRVWSGV